MVPPPWRSITMVQGDTGHGPARLRLATETENPRPIVVGRRPAVHPGLKDSSRARIRDPSIAAPEAPGLKPALRLAEGGHGPVIGNAVARNRRNRPHGSRHGGFGETRAPHDLGHVVGGIPHPHTSTQTRREEHEASKYDEVTPEELADALRRATSDAEMRQRSMAVAETLRREPGVDGAVAKLRQVLRDDVRSGAAQARWEAEEEARRAERQLRFERLKARRAERQQRQLESRGAEAVAPFEPPSRA